MNTELVLPQEILVKKIEKKDIQGFFSSKVEIPSGVKAVVWENDANCGEIGPGDYTFETFSSRIFCGSKDLVLYPYRSDDFSIVWEAICLTKDSLRVNCEIKLDFAIDNASLFIKNLIGSRLEYSVSEFQKDVDLIILQAINEAASAFSLRELMQAAFGEYVTTALENAVLVSLGRYGIRFKDSKILSIAHDFLNQEQQAKERIWLLNEQMKIDEQEREQQLAIRLASITHEEKLNDLEILEKQVRADRKDGELTVIKRRIEQKKKLHDLIQSETFDKLASQTAMEQFLAEQEKAGILRENERKDLLRGLEWGDTEKEHRRAHSLKMLDQQLSQEMILFQRKCQHELDLKKLAQEMELAQKTESEQNRQWRMKLERESADRKARLEALEGEQKETEAAGKIKIEQEKLENALTLLRLEREKAVAEASEERQRQILLREQEVQQKETKNMLDKLKALNEIKAERNRVKQELWENSRRLDAELKNDETRLKHSLKQEIIRSLSGMDPQTAQMVILGSVADPQMQNTLLEYFKVLEHSKGNEVETQVAKVRAEEKELSMARMEEMMRKMTETMERNADRLVQMNGQAMNALGKSNAVIMPGAGSANSAIAPNDPEEIKKMICPSCRAEVRADSRFCSNCGKQL